MGDWPGVEWCEHLGKKGKSHMNPSEGFTLGFKALNQGLLPQSGGHVEIWVMCLSMKFVLDSTGIRKT